MKNVLRFAFLNDRFSLFFLSVQRQISLIKHINKTAKNVVSLSSHPSRCGSSMSTIRKASRNSLKSITPFLSKSMLVAKSRICLSSNFVTPRLPRNEQTSVNSCKEITPEERERFFYFRGRRSFFYLSCLDRSLEKPFRADLYFDKSLDKDFRVAKRKDEKKVENESN